MKASQQRQVKLLLKFLSRFVSSGCPSGHDPMRTANQIAAKGIVIYMVGCEPSILTWKDWFMAVAHITGGQYVPLASAQMLASVTSEFSLFLDH